MVILFTFKYEGVVEKRLRSLKKKNNSHIILWTSRLLLTKYSYILIQLPLGNAPGFWCEGNKFKYLLGHLYLLLKPIKSLWALNQLLDIVLPYAATKVGVTLLCDMSIMTLLWFDACLLTWAIFSNIPFNCNFRSFGLSTRSRMMTWLVQDSNQRNEPCN